MMPHVLLWSLAWCSFFHNELFLVPLKFWSLSAIIYINFYECPSPCPGVGVGGTRGEDQRGEEGAEPSRNIIHFPNSNSGIKYFLKKYVLHSDLAG